MEITRTNFVWTGGDYPAFRYTIQNTSPPGFTNSLHFLALPVGIGAGLISAQCVQFPFEWTISYGWDQTFFSNDYHSIQPGDALTVEIVAYSPATRFQFATARGYDPFGFVDFTPVLVEVPAGPYPQPVLTQPVIGSNTVTLTAQLLVPSYDYTLQQSSDAGTWTNVLSFHIAALNDVPTRTLAVPLPASAPRQLYRLSSP